MGPAGGLRVPLHSSRPIAYQLPRRELHIDIHIVEFEFAVYEYEHRASNLPDLNQDHPSPSESDPRMPLKLSRFSQLCMD